MEVSSVDEEYSTAERSFRLFDYRTLTICSLVFFKSILSIIFWQGGCFDSPKTHAIYKSEYRKKYVTHSSPVSEYKTKYLCF